MGNGRFHGGKEPICVLKGGCPSSAIDNRGITPKATTTCIMIELNKIESNRSYNNQQYRVFQ